MNYLAPLLTIALFCFCFVVAVFLRLAIGKPTFLRDEKPKRPTPRKKTSKKFYFVADLKPIVEEREESVEEIKYEKRPKRRAGRHISR